MSRAETNYSWVSALVDLPSLLYEQAAISLKFMLSNNIFEFEHERYVGYGVTANIAASHE